MAWRLAKSLDVLRAEIRAISRQQTIYTIGDAAHQARPSDHNPNTAGVVCAIDVMVGHGLDMGDLTERIAASGHPALKYIIYNRRIWIGGRWKSFSGDPHTDHAHLSAGAGPDGQSTGPYDDTRPWLTPGAVKPVPLLDNHGLGRRVLRLAAPRMEGDDVAFVQRWIGDRCGTADGIYGAQTAAGVRWYQQMRGIPSDGVVGPVTWAHMGISA